MYHRVNEKVFLNLQQQQDNQMTEKPREESSGRFQQPYQDHRNQGIVENNVIQENAIGNQLLQENKVSKEWNHMNQGYARRKKLPEFNSNRDNRVAQNHRKHNRAYVHQGKKSNTNQQIHQANSESNGLSKCKNLVVSNAMELSTTSSKVDVSSEYSNERINPNNNAMLYYQQLTVNNQTAMLYNRHFTSLDEYYLKRLYNHNSRSEIPSSLLCQSPWDGVSQNIWDKYMMFRQSNSTYCQKIRVWCELYELLQRFPIFQYRTFSNWSLHLVGSTISGFGLDSSDVDICLVVRSAPQFDPRAEAVATLNEIKNYLADIGYCFKDFYLITAKVPILRFRDCSNSIEIDLNYNNSVGIRNTHLMNCYAQLDWRLRPLIVIIKLWAQHHNLNDARHGTISSYSLVLMTIHFLQFAVKPCVLPCLHNLLPEKFKLLHDITTIDVLEQLNIEWKSDNNRPIGELFLRFLDYYSNFDYVHNAISIRTGGTLPIEYCKNVRTQKNDSSHWQTLCVEEPFDLTNTARSTYDWDIFAKIKNAFFQSWRKLNETKNLNTLFQDPLFIKQIPRQQIYGCQDTPSKC